jgi:hypothetical protein
MSGSPFFSRPYASALKFSKAAAHLCVELPKRFQVVAAHSLNRSESKALADFSRIPANWHDCCDAQSASQMLQSLEFPSVQHGGGIPSLQGAASDQFLNSSNCQALRLDCNLVRLRGNHDCHETPALGAT